MTTQEEPMSVPVAGLERARTVEALARALDNPRVWKAERDGRLAVDVANVLASISPAGRLAIAGITEDRLATVLHHELSHYERHVNPQTETHRVQHEYDARAVIAALSETLR